MRIGYRTFWQIDLGKKITPNITFVEKKIHIIDYTNTIIWTFLSAFHIILSSFASLGSENLDFRDITVNGSYYLNMLKCQSKMMMSK